MLTLPKTKDNADPELRRIEGRIDQRKNTLAKIDEMIHAAELGGDARAMEVETLQHLQRIVLLEDIRDLARRNALSGGPSPSPSLDGAQIQQQGSDCDLADARLDEHQVADRQVHPADDVVPLAPDVTEPVFDERREPERWHDPVMDDRDVIAQRNAEDASQPQREFSDVY
ncbi:MAG: hypothetical protein WBD40_01335 [Tepidisphaeraceae bacterium]